MGENRKKKLLTKVDIAIAKVCAFYGYMPDKVRAMDAQDFAILSECIGILEAQNLLALLPVYNFFKLKKTNRDKVHRQLLKFAYPGILDQRRQLTLKDVGELLAARRL